MNSPLVTVIIPTYNHARYLGEAIQSVLNQTYDNYELLILDDHSSDSTPDVVNEFKDSRIRYIRHECNIGLIANWTYGVKWGSAQYLSILSDDDIYKPNFVRRRVEGFSECNDLVAVTGRFECAKEDGRIFRMSTTSFEGKAIVEGDDLLKLTLSINGEWFNGATLYHANSLRSVWNKAVLGGTALDLASHIYLSLIQDSKILFLPESHIILRVHPEQESQLHSLYLAECGAKLAIQFWYVECKDKNRSTRKIFKQGLARQLHSYAALLWEKGRIKESKKILVNELLINPTRLTPWLMLLRYYLRGFLQVF